jgi:hypothetical protein
LNVSSFLLNRSANVLVKLLPELAEILDLVQAVKLCGHCTVAWFDQLQFVCVVLDTEADVTICHRAIPAKALCDGQ